MEEKSPKHLQNVPSRSSPYTCAHNRQEVAWEKRRQSDDVIFLSYAKWNFAKCRAKWTRGLLNIQMRAESVELWIHKAWNERKSMSMTFRRLTVAVGAVEFTSLNWFDPIIKPVQFIELSRVLISSNQSLTRRAGGISCRLRRLSTHKAFRFLDRGCNGA